jgi:hypothetical protein
MKFLHRSKTNQKQFKKVNLLKTFIATKRQLKKISKLFEPKKRFTLQIFCQRRFENLM